MWRLLACRCPSSGCISELSTSYSAAQYVAGGVQVGTTRSADWGCCGVPRHLATISRSSDAPGGSGGIAGLLSSALPSSPLVTMRWKQHWAQRRTGPNLLQDCDTNDINASIRAVTYLEHAATPAFTYNAHLSPAQASWLLARLPRVLRYQHSRRRPAAGQTELLAGVLDAVGGRLAGLVGRCKGTELANALWAFGTLRQDHPALFSNTTKLIADLASQKRTTRSKSSTVTPITTTEATSLLPKVRSPITTTNATSAAAKKTQSLLTLANIGATSSSTPALLTVAVAVRAATQRHAGQVLGNLSPLDLSTVAWAYAARLPAGNQGGNAKALQPLLDVLEKSGLAETLDQRSVCKLAWAMARAKVRHEPLLKALAVAATRQINAQLALHDPVSGPLQSRRRYRYRTIRGVVEQDTPKTPRPSRYLRKYTPFIIVRDYEYGTLASLLNALAKLDIRDPELAEAAAAHVIATAAVGHANPAGAGGTVGQTASGTASTGGTAGQTASGTSQTDAVATHPVKRPAARDVVRMLRGLHHQGCKTPGLAEAVLAHARLHEMQASQLVEVTRLATLVGARDQLLMRRLSRALYADREGMKALGVTRISEVLMAYQRAEFVDVPVHMRLVTDVAARLAAAAGTALTVGTVMTGGIMSPETLAKMFTALVASSKALDLTPLARSAEKYVLDPSSTFTYSFGSRDAASMVKLLAASSSPNKEAMRHALKCVNVNIVGEAEHTLLTQLLEEAGRQAEAAGAAAAAGAAVGAVVGAAAA